MKYIIFIFCCLFFPAASLGQAVLKVRVIDSPSAKPVAFAQISIGGQVITLTDTNGAASITMPPGKYAVTANATGFASKTIDVVLPEQVVQLINMTASEESLEEVTIVSSTRNNEQMENSPLKVEVLGKEEVSEEAGLKPGNIASILGDVSGVQIQQSSAVSGNSNVRIQGLPGRYTQILRDGMPLYDGFSGGFGILTIPPLDLRQIEFIKGSASTLFGGGAIGGLVNLISKRPTFNQEADVLVNYSSLAETDVNTYFAKRYKKIGYTFFAGYVNQQPQDVDNDGLSDVARSSSLLIHPKVFFYPNDKTIISVGYSGTFDDRKGGDMKVLRNEGDSIHRFYEQNQSERHTGDYTAERFFKNNTKLVIKGSASSFSKAMNSNTEQINANQFSYYQEISMSKDFKKATLVAGLNAVGDNYHVTKPETLPLTDFSNNTLGAFAQYSLHLRPQTIAEAGIRADHHDTKGDFVLPRVALFHRINEAWAVRLGFGMGYKVPNPLAQQDIEYDAALLLKVPDNVKAEVSYGYNAEVNYKTEWDEHHTLFINHAFFLTSVHDPITFQNTIRGYVGLRNENKPLNTMGTDTYLKLKLDTWEIYGGFTYTDARRTYIDQNNFVPLTPRNRAAMVVTKEIEKKWRFGVEGSYTDVQYRYNGTKTPGYFIAAVMVSRQLGPHVFAVLNCENAPDYRMTREEKIYNGVISNPQFKPLWAPIDGRVFNLSLRWKL